LVDLVPPFARLLEVDHPVVDGQPLGAGFVEQGVVPEVERLVEDVAAVGLGVGVEVRVDHVEQAWVDRDGDLAPPPRRHAARHGRILAEAALRGRKRAARRR
jgi:hypothetical protein